MSKLIFSLVILAVVSSCSGPGGGEEKTAAVSDSAAADTVKKRTDMDIYEDKEKAFLRQQLLECSNAYHFLELELVKKDSIINAMEQR